MQAPAPLLSSESEMEVAETSALLGGSFEAARGVSWCSCWRAPGCHRVWRVLTPSVLKTIVMVAVFMTTVVLFTRFPEAEDGGFMYAVSRDEPMSYAVGPAAALEATLWVQRVTAVQSALAGVEVRLRIESGSVCTANSSDALCGLALRLQTTQRATVTDSFRLDPRAAGSTVRLTTNSSVPVAVMLKVLELSDVASASVVIAGIVLIVV
jgi:hypothetical protein